MKSLTLIIAFLLLTSCQNEKKENTSLFHSTVMTIEYRIIVGKVVTPHEHEVISHTINTVFNEINSIYNKWNPDSEVSKLNNLKAGVISPLSPSLETFLHETKRIVDLTEGRFDPTIEPLQALWKQQLEKKEVLDQTRIATVLAAVGWNKIHFGNGIFYKDHDATKLDLGGIAKGFAVDLLIERLNEKGFPDLFVEWGGEIRASGKHPDNRPWNIFISRLGDRNPNNAIAHLSLSNEAIATSGDYLQYWEVPDNDKMVKYFHIFDSKSGSPLEIREGSISSSSVLASTCMFADGLATAALMFSTSEEAQKWAESVQEQYPEVKFWFLTRN